jgi:hypothetical protein
MLALGGTRGARISGCVLGVLLAAAFLIGSRPAMGGQALGAEVSVTANPTGELSVTPAAPTPVLHERAIKPGEVPVSGTLELRNQTGEALSVQIGALTSAHELDDSLQVEFRSGSEMLRSGPVGGMRAPGGTPLLLEAGAAVPLTASVSLAEGAPNGWEAVLADIGVIFTVQPAGAPSHAGGKR